MWPHEVIVEAAKIVLGFTGDSWRKIQAVRLLVNAIPGVGAVQHDAVALAHSAWARAASSTVQPLEALDTGDKAHDDGSKAVQ